ncbi:MAG TPA: radical SAM protein [Polyangia bacterium]|nr:radical SAM protein [Polyangia bacterium]
MTGTLAPVAAPARRHLPLATTSRAVDRRYRPTHAIWEITLRCDLACRHCGSRAGRARPDELDTAACLDLVGQMAALGVLEVSLIGGEAYLRPDWLAIITAIRQAGMQCTMVTGGRGLDEEKARAAAGAGLQNVSVSIDGCTAAHDSLRGVAGAHRSALEAARHLTAAGIPVSVNTQINRLSLPDLPAVLEDVIGLGAHAWQIMLTVAMGRAADAPELLLQPFELLALFPLLARLGERCDAAGVRLLPGNNIGYFGPYEHVLRRTFPGGHMGSCGAGCTTLGIEADGSIKGCPSLQTVPWTGGNIRDASLQDIWERAAPLRVIRDRTVDDLWGFCRTCYYADDCRAGCTWTGFSLFGKAGNNPLCHHRALEMQRRGLRERLVQVAPAPGAPFDHGLFEIVVEDANEHAAPLPKL